MQYGIGQTEACRPAVRDATFVKTPPSFSNLMTFGEESYTYPVPRKKRAGLESFINTDDLSWFGSVFNGPSKYYMRDILSKQTGSKGGTYTENDLPRAQLDVLDQQVRSVVRRNGITQNYFRTHPHDTLTLSCNGNEMYPELYGRGYGRNENLFDKLFTPLGNVEHTLGSYNVDVFSNGYRVFDTYDYNTGQGNFKGSRTPYAVLRRLGYKYGHRDTDPNESKIHFNINRTVNRWPENYSNTNVGFSQLPLPPH